MRKWQHREPWSHQKHQNTWQKMWSQPSWALGDSRYLQPHISWAVSRGRWVDSLGARAHLTAGLCPLPGHGSLEDDNPHPSATWSPRTQPALDSPRCPQGLIKGSLCFAELNLLRAQWQVQELLWRQGELGVADALQPGRAGRCRGG